MTVEPTNDQFELTELGVFHVPAGAEFVPHPGSTSGTFKMGRLGNTAPTDDDFSPGEVGPCGGSGQTM